MEEDFRGVAEARVSRFLQFIRKYGRDNEKKIVEDGQREEDFQNNKIKSQANMRDEEVFKKMEDGVKVAQKIFKSRKVNQCRMQEMKVRFDMIQRVQEQAKKKLQQQANDPEQYRSLLKGLITQGLIKLVEEDVEIRCLKSDQKIVSQVMAECQAEFNETCVVKTNLTINTANYLSSQDLGGIILTSLTGRIVCDNTLRARLSYCLQLLLPSIRSMLFEDSDRELRQRRQEKKEQEMKAKAAA